MEDDHLKIISKSKLKVSLKGNLSFFRKSLFAPALRNVEHEFCRNPIGDFLNFNVIETKNLRHSLNNLLKYRIFEYAFFLTEKERERMNAAWERHIVTEGMPTVHVPELYGNTPIDDIDSDDFIKTDFDEFVSYMKDYLRLLKHHDCDDQQIQDFKEIFKKSLLLLAHHTPEHRVYYIMDQDCIPSYRKRPYGFYDYYITVISTLRYSNQVVVMEFGQD